MSATKQLMQEHEAILKVLAVMDELNKKLFAGEIVNTEHIAKIIDFLKTFADKCHHAKEEKHLFPAMVAAGVPAEGGPIGVMLHEHVLGRNFIKGMNDSLEAYESGEPGSGERLAQNMDGYIQLLTAHIQKENNILFVIADNRLSPGQQQLLLTEFDRVETEEIGGGKHEEYHELINFLVNEYKV